MFLKLRSLSVEPAAPRSQKPRTPALSSDLHRASNTGAYRISKRGNALCGRYLVPIVPLVPWLENQLSVSVSALVQTLHLLHVDPTVQSVLQAPLRGLVFPLATAAVAVTMAVTVPGHRGAKNAAVGYSQRRKTEQETSVPLVVFIKWNNCKFKFATRSEHASAKAK